MVIRCAYAIKNLSDAKRQKEVLPSTVEAACNGIYVGHASLHMKLDALDSVAWVIKNHGKDQGKQ